MSLQTRLTSLTQAVGADIKNILSPSGTVVDGITYSKVYVSQNWATDPNNPANGGSMPVNPIILEE